MAYNPTLNQTTISNSLSYTLNSTVDFTNLGYSTVAFTLIVPTGGETTFQGSYDGVTYIDIILRNVSTDQYITTTTINGSFIGSISGLQTFRIKTTIVGTGSVGNISGTMSPQVSTLKGIEHSSPNDFELSLAEGKIANHSIIHKFGRNSDIDTGTVPEDIWEGGGLYTGFPIGDVETVDVYSTSTSDTSAGVGAKTVLIKGLDSNFNYIEEVVTLNGTTHVTSVNQYSRCNVGIVKSAGTSLGNVGLITCEHTSISANVFFAIPVGLNRTHVSAYTIPAGYTGYIKKLYFTLQTGGNNDQDCNVDLMIRPFNQVFQSRRPLGLSSGYEINDTIYGGIKVDEKSDIVLRVFNVSLNNTAITGGFDLILQKN